MFEDEIFEWISAGTGMTEGTDLQLIDWNTDAPDRSTAVMFPGNTKESIEELGWVDIRLQIVSRGPAWRNANDDITAIHTFIFINYKSHVELPPSSPTFRIETIIPETGPFYLGKDNAFRFLYTSIYNLRIRRL